MPFLRTFLVPKQSPEHPRIFFIGYNKCGTKTFHNFLKKNGVSSAHTNYNPTNGGKRTRLATTMRNNAESGRPVLAGMVHHRAFSDLITLSEHEVIEANEYFREMHQDHPDAFFIFNDRPLEDWIRSRLNHEGGPGGSFLGRYANATGLDRAAVPDLWRTTYKSHKEAVLKYFSDKPRFFHFDITKHGPNELRELFGAEIPLDVRHWEVRGTSEERKRNHQRKARRIGL